MEVDNLEVAHAMGRLIQEGLVREWGISTVDKAQLEAAHAVTPVGAVQNIYSMVERTSEKDVIPFCVGNGIAFVPFSPADFYPEKLHRIRSSARSMTCVYGFHN